MGIDKSEFKMQVVHDLGATIEDKLDGVRKEVDRYDGAKQALQQAATCISSLLQHVDRDLDEGRYNEIDGPLQVAKIAKDYIQKAVGSLDNLATSAEVNGIRARGKVEGLEQAVALAKKTFDDEAKKQSALTEALASGAATVEQHPVGAHPSVTDAAADLAERRAAAKREKEARKAQPQESIVVEAMAPVVGLPPGFTATVGERAKVPEPPKSLRDRPKGNKNKLKPPET